MLVDNVFLEKLFSKRFYLITPLIIIYSIFIVVYYFVFLTASLSPLAIDLVSFLTGAGIMRAGESKLLYDVNIQFGQQLAIVAPFEKTNLLPFRSLPLTALMFLPLSYLPLTSAYWVMVIVNFMLLFVSTSLLAKSVKNERHGKIIYLLPFFFLPTAFSIILSQYLSLIFLILTLVYLSLKRENEFFCGMLTSLLIIKLQFILFAPFVFILAKKRTKFLLGFLTGLISMLALIFAITGFVRMARYPMFLTVTETVEYGSRYWHMYSLGAFWQFVFGNFGKNFFLIVNFLLYLFSLAFFWKKKNLNLEMLFSAAILLTLFFSPHTLTHDLMVLMLPVFLLLSKLRKFSGKVKLGIKFLLISLFLYPFLIFTGNVTWSAPFLPIAAAYLLRVKEK